MRNSRLLIALALFFAARPAFAQGCLNCSVPNIIHLVASNGVQPAVAFGEFEVVVRDLANNLIAGALVTVDFSQNPDLRLCSAQPYPGVQVDCPNQRASVITDVAGRARFTLLGGSIGAGGASSIGFGALIRVNGSVAGSPIVTAFDLDGAVGVGGSDLAVFIGDFASGVNWCRSDYDGTGILGGGDLAFWLTAFSSGTQVVSCAATCP